MIATLLLAFPLLAADPAKPHDHQGKFAPFRGAPPAVSLSAADLTTLQAGKVVLKQVQSANGGRGVAVMDVHATPTVIWSRITNFEMYPRWVDNVALCEVYRNDGTNIFTRFVLDPFGVEVEYFIHHVYKPTAGYLTWTLDYGRQSDLDDSVGYWRVTPVTTQPPVSRLEYSVDIRFEGWVPGFLQDMISEKGLTNATTWVKKQSEGG